MDSIKRYGIWVAIAICVVAFAGAGGAKLAGVPMVHEAFAKMGLPGWFGYFIGACELAGAIGLLIRPLSAWAAGGLAIIMVGATYFHITNPPLSEGVPAIVLLLLSIFIFTRRRESMLALR